MARVLYVLTGSPAADAGLQRGDWIVSFDGNAIKAGDYLALVDNQLFDTEKDLDAVLDKLGRAAADRDAEFLSIFYGADVSAADAEQASSREAQETDYYRKKTISSRYKR